MPINLSIINGITISNKIIPLIQEYKNKSDANAEAMMNMMKLTVRVNHGNNQLSDFDDRWNRLVAGL